MTTATKFAAGGRNLPTVQHGAAVGCDGPVSSLETNYPGASASGAFPDPHRARKLATIHTAPECEGWIAEARRLGNTDAERAALARLYEIQRGRK